MRSVWESTLKEIRDTTATDKPVATSGAISVISSVYGCSLLRMALEISLKKVRTRQGIDKMAGLLNQVAGTSAELSKLADRDIEVFHRFLERFSLPEDTADQKKLRKEELDLSRLEAIRVPLTAAEEIIKLYSVIFEAIPLTGKNVLPDLGVCANLFYSAISGLLWSARVNAKKLKEVPRLHLETTARVLRNDAKAATKQVNRVVSKALGIS